eukprot:3496308-Pyramimonas_sp.AAC.1
MAIASIAESDWPQAWPELTPTLIQMIRQRASADQGESSLRTFTKLSQLFLSIAFGSNLKICFAGFAVNGGLRCLSMIASDIDEAQMPQGATFNYLDMKAVPNTISTPNMAPPSRATIPSSRGFVYWVFVGRLNLYVGLERLSSTGTEHKV